MGFRRIHSHSDRRMRGRQHLSDCCFLDFTRRHEPRGHAYMHAHAATPAGHMPKGHVNALRPILSDFSNAPFGPEKSLKASARKHASATQCLLQRYYFCIIGAALLRAPGG